MYSFFIEKELSNFTLKFIVNLSLYKYFLYIISVQKVFLGYTVDFSM